MANLIVPRRPGLGVTVDESVIERYPVDSGAVVAVPHGFAGADARGDERSQRAVGYGGEVGGRQFQAVKRRLKAGCSQDWLPHRFAGMRWLAVTMRACPTN